MIELVKALLFGTAEPTVIRECRRCGTSVSASVTHCPKCGADAIVQYRTE